MCKCNNFRISKLTTQLLHIAFKLNNYDFAAAVMSLPNSPSPTTLGVRLQETIETTQAVRLALSSLLGMQLGHCPHLHRYTSQAVH